MTQLDPKFDPETLRPRLEEFLRELIKTSRFHLKFRIDAAPTAASASPSTSPETSNDEGAAPALIVRFDGEDSDILLQRSGELLDALEHVATKVLRLSIEEQGLISFDCHDFRMLHEAELLLMAETAAERVEHSGTPFELSPMDSRSRRIVHLALQGRPGVRTESEGGGPYRHIVIHPQKKK